MEFTFETPADTGDMALSGHDPATPLGDVVESIAGGPVPAVLYVDGRVLPAATPLGVAALRTGSIVSLDAPRAFDMLARPDPSAVVELVQVAGAGAGRRCWLAPGRYVVGHGRRAALAHLEAGAVTTPVFRVEVDQRGTCTVAASTGTVVLDGHPIDDAAPRRWRGGTLVAGERAFRVRRPPPGDQRRGGIDVVRGVVPFNRPPRPTGGPATPPLVVVPDGGRAVLDRRRFPLLALVAPIPLAVAMAVMMQRPQMLLFGLLSPVMMLANWIEERRSRRRDVDSSTRADAAAQAEFRHTVQQAHRAERDAARTANPDIATLIERAVGSMPELWERRPGDDDAWQVPVGAGDVAWAPQLQRGHGSIGAADDIVAAAGPLPMVPVVADFGTGLGLAIVGTEPAALPVARGVVLAAAILHGPADLDIVVCTDRRRAALWEWMKWLPHCRSGDGARVFTERDQIVRWAAAAHDTEPGPDPRAARRHLTLVVVDQEDWWHDRDAPLRALLGQPSLPLRYLAITTRSQTVPSVCSTVIGTGTGDGGAITVTGARPQGISALPFSVDAELATFTARRLAPVEDTDVEVTGHAALPYRQTILDLLDLGDPTPAAIADRWRRAGRTPRPRAAVGVTEHGPLEIDLVADGPHGLVAGTTGAGKSELLRSLVVSYACALPPDALNFVLVDFKGGSAFDACANLPHTVGLVTDLDEHLAGRVLRCLRAELHHREVVLRAAGVTALDEYHLLDGVDPLPRLVLVVDEFASLAAELPAFVPSLVDLARRGRSLGIHMILATQRPAGVVDANIKANTDLRIALRVQDDAESIDVVNVRDAAHLPRHLPGRALARFAAGDVVAFQSAYSSGVTGDSAQTVVGVEPWVVARPPTPLEAEAALAHVDPEAATGAATGEAAPSDLTRLAAAIGEAARHLGQDAQRRPYVDPLPDHVPWAGLAGEDDEGVAIGLVDLPDEQRQAVRRWAPGPDGSLLVYGVSGAGTSSLLVTLALGLGCRSSPDDVHVYAVDADAGMLDAIAALPHCGAVVTAADLPRVARLCRVLVGEMARRRRLAIELGSPARVVDTEPAIVLLIDNVGALRQAVEDDRAQAATWADLEQVIRDGPGLGLCTVVAATHERALPTSMASQFPNRLVLRLADATAYASFGIRAADVPVFVPGRAVDPGDQTALQLACPPTDVATAVDEAARRWPRPHRAVTRVDPLPGTVLLSSVLPAADTDDHRIGVPIGLDAATASPAVLHLDDGGSALVTGPPRSGRSTVLSAVAVATLAGHPGTPVYAVCPRGGPLGDVSDLAGLAVEPAQVAPLLSDALSIGGRRIVLVDDADRLGGPTFDALAAHDDDHLVIVIAGRADELRVVGHWSKPLQRTRTGVLLRPVATDGDLLRVSLPLRLPHFEVGGGFLVDDGQLSPLLAARPEMVP